MSTLAPVLTKSKTLIVLIFTILLGVVSWLSGFLGHIDKIIEITCKYHFDILINRGYCEEKRQKETKENENIERIRTERERNIHDQLEAAKAERLKIERENAERARAEQQLAEQMRADQERANRAREEDAKKEKERIKENREKEEKFYKSNSFAGMVPGIKVATINPPPTEVEDTKTYIKTIEILSGSWKSEDGKIDINFRRQGNLISIETQGGACRFMGSIVEIDPMLSYSKLTFGNLSVSNACNQAAKETRKIEVANITDSGAKLIFKGNSIWYFWIFK